MSLVSRVRLTPGSVPGYIREDSGGAVGPPRRHPIVPVTCQTTAMRHPLLTVHCAVASLSTASHLVFHSQAAADPAAFECLTCPRHHGVELSFHLDHEKNLAGFRTRISTNMTQVHTHSHLLLHSLSNMCLLIILRCGSCNPTILEYLLTWSIRESTKAYLRLFGSSSI